MRAPRGLRPLAPVLATWRLGGSSVYGSLAISKPSLHPLDLVIPAGRVVALEAPEVRVERSVRAERDDRRPRAPRRADVAEPVPVAVANLVFTLAVRRAVRLRVGAAPLLDRALAGDRLVREER